MKLNDLPTEALNKEGVPMIRIEWHINNTSGYGAWFDASECSMLQAHVDDANNCYGYGTHRITTAAALLEKDH